MNHDDPPRDDPAADGGRLANDTQRGCMPGDGAVEARRSDDPSRADWMRLVQTTAVLEFWSDEAEDLYTLDDGEPL